MTPHCEGCPFPGCDSCAYKGHERGGWGGVWACSTCLTEAVAS